VRALIRGRVQGVGFRAFVLRTARGLGAHGTVRNRGDGSVEVVVVAEAGVVEQMLGALQRGPQGARVDTVDTQAVVPVPVLAGFEIVG
jgi:acylphosphatase